LAAKVQAVERLVVVLLPQGVVRERVPAEESALAQPWLVQR
tara:strand:+ start:239 stop:361 length:123 start_codon:yes stop_codon:yes gene_type:complete